MSRQELQLCSRITSAVSRLAGTGGLESCGGDLHDVERGLEAGLVPEGEGKAVKGLSDSARRLAASTAWSASAGRGTPEYKLTVTTRTLKTGCHSGVAGRKL